MTVMAEAKNMEKRGMKIIKFVGCQTGGLGKTKQLKRGRATVRK